jgi:Fe-Mn family superoxide dismutase
MTHLLPDLPYKLAALEPHIDARTMALHYEKHHAGYVANLNAALKGLPSLQNLSASWLLLHLNLVPESTRAAVANNAGGHFNHSLYWRAMAPPMGDAPAGPLAAAIKRDFGGTDQLKAQFDEAGEALFGSGWVWLVRAPNDDGKLSVVTTHGHESPLTQGQLPILVNDVWEHAYYLKHQNRRADFLADWWAVVNWAEAARRFGRSDHHLAEQGWEDEGGKVLAA